MPVNVKPTAVLGGATCMWCSNVPEGKKHLVGCGCGSPPTKIDAVADPAELLTLDTDLNTAQPLLGPWDWRR